MHPSTNLMTAYYIRWNQRARVKTDRPVHPSSDIHEPDIHERNVHTHDDVNAVAAEFFFVETTNAEHNRLVRHPRT